MRTTTTAHPRTDELLDAARKKIEDHLRSAGTTPHTHLTPGTARWRRVAAQRPGVFTGLVVLAGIVPAGAASLLLRATIPGFEPQLFDMIAYTLLAVAGISAYSWAWSSITDVTYTANRPEAVYALECAANAEGAINEHAVAAPLAEALRNPMRALSSDIFVLARALEELTGARARDFATAVAAEPYMALSARWAKVDATISNKRVELKELTAIALAATWAVRDASMPQVATPAEPDTAAGGSAATDVTAILTAALH